MQTRLLTDEEAMQVAHELYLVHQDQEKRLQALQEDGHPEREAAERVLSSSMRLLAVVERETGRLTRREVKFAHKEADCLCHRELTHEEGIALNEAMDSYSDNIRHLFNTKTEAVSFAYLAQLGRELCRVDVYEGNVYFGRPAARPDVDDVTVIHVTKESTSRY